MTALLLCLVVVAADPPKPSAKAAEILQALHLEEGAKWQMYLDAAHKTKAELNRKPIYIWTNPTRSGGQNECVYASGSPALVNPALLATRRAIILCGLPGDADHRKLFGESVELLYDGLTHHHGFKAEDVHVLWPDAPVEKDGPAVKSTRDIATREAVAKSVEEIRAALTPSDALWVFVLGHGHYDARQSWLNLPGPDISHVEFGQLFAKVACKEQVFFITTPCSGFYLKALAQPGRIVITATEPDLEVNETNFPHKLAKAIGSPPSYGEFDLDQDRHLTLLDLYLWAARETAQEYASGELAATEHAQIDDSGDGRGTELQIDYLPEALGGRLRAGSNPPKPKGAGNLARKVFLDWPLSPPAPLVGQEE